MLDLTPAVVTLTQFAFLAVFVGFLVMGVSWAVVRISIVITGGLED